MKFQPIHRSRIIAALTEAGPMTSPELAEYLNLPTDTVSACIASARWLLPEQVFRIVRHQPLIGRRGRDLAVYAAEAGPDVQRKPINLAKRRKEVEARYRKKNRALINARNRAKSPAPANPWLQLAPPEMRAAISLHGRAD